MVRTTEHPWNGRRPLARTGRLTRTLALFGLAGLVLVALAGCSAPSQGTGVSSAGSSTIPGMPGAHMAGPAAQVHISKSTFDAKPAPIVVTTPESAVRSYLDWTSYAYRIGDATVAQGTM